MLCAVVSSARWWASRPRSAVFRPKKLETAVIASRLEVERPARGGARGRGGQVGGAGLGGRAVAGVRGRAHQPGQVVEEGELLAHQGAVDAVLAGDLAEQAAQLAAAIQRAAAVGGLYQRGQSDARGGLD